MASAKGGAESFYARKDFMIEQSKMMKEKYKSLIRIIYEKKI